MLNSVTKVALAIPSAVRARPNDTLSKSTHMISQEAANVRTLGSVSRGRYFSWLHSASQQLPPLSYWELGNKGTHTYVYMYIPICIHRGYIGIPPPSSGV